MPVAMTTRLDWNSQAVYSAGTTYMEWMKCITPAKNALSQKRLNIKILFMTLPVFIHNYIHQSWNLCKIMLILELQKLKYKLQSCCSRIACNFSKL